MSARKSLYHLISSLISTAVLLGITQLAIAGNQMAPREIGPKQRCPVCGMYPAQYPKWHAEIIFKDNKMTAFDSPADLFRYMYRMGKKGQHINAEEVSAIYVTDYLTGHWENAHKAYFVLNSRINGPMGNDLPAFADRKEARKFVTKSGGMLMTFKQITPSIIGKLHGGGMDMKKMKMNMKHSKSGAMKEMPSMAPMSNKEMSK